MPDDDDDQDVPRNIDSMQTPDVADSPRRFNWIYSPQKLKNI